MREKTFLTWLLNRIKSIFVWPPQYHSRPTLEKAKYRHEVTVASSENAEYAYTLYFTSEPKARAFKRAAEQSTNKPITEYKRKELPFMNGEWIEE
jgi:hypothetical protein